MTAFLIVVAVLAVLITAVLCLSATITLIYDNGWTTKISVLFIKKDIELSKILSFLLFPEKKAEQAAENSKNKKKKKKDKKAEANAKPQSETVVNENTGDVPDTEKSVEEKALPQEAGAKSDKSKPQKSNPIKKLWDDEGIVGMLSLVSNLLETANSAILTLFRGLHIYSLYVMIIVGGEDADVIARSYGRLCKYYYPVKGIILNGMKVDNYDDYIQPDFIAPKTEFEMQFIAGISVGLIVKMALKAVFVFLKNFIKDRKTNK